jgi:hypothetical protein
MAMLRRSETPELRAQGARRRQRRQDNLLDDGDGNYLPQFQSEPGGPCLPPACMPGRWRSVTGDIDFLSMTDLNGKGLSADKRVELYKN